ncbi:MAG: hypothetical protein ABEI74_00360 [Candidatus Pacearchaeota archaeon]
MVPWATKAMMIFIVGYMIGKYFAIGRPAPVEVPTVVDVQRGFEVETCIGEKAVGTYSDSKRELFITLPEWCECQKETLVNYTNGKCQWK